MGIWEKSNDKLENKSIQLLKDQISKLDSSEPNLTQHTLDYEVRRAEAMIELGKMIIKTRQSEIKLGV